MPRGSRSGWPPSRVISTGSACSVLDAAGARLGAGVRERAREIGRGHRATVDLELDRGAARARPAGSDAEHHLAQGLAGLLLGLVDHRQRSRPRPPRRRRSRRRAALRPAGSRRPAPRGAARRGGARSGSTSWWCRCRARRSASRRPPGRGSPVAARPRRPRHASGVLQARSGSSRSRSRFGRKRRSITATARSSSASSRALAASRRQAPQRVLLRQQHVDPIVEVQRPAPVADPGRGDHPLRQRGLGREQREQPCGLVRRARRRPARAAGPSDRRIGLGRRCRALASRQAATSARSPRRRGRSG